jgi:hypothetical protein
MGRELRREDSSHFVQADLGRQVGLGSASALALAQSPHIPTHAPLTGVTPCDLPQL